MKNRYFVKAEIAFAILGILFFSGSLTGLSVALIEIVGVSPDQMKTLISLIRYLVWYGSAALILVRWRVAWAMAGRNIFVWLVAGLVLMSTIWSTDPTYTSIAVKEVTRMTLFGVYLASRFKLRGQLYLMATTFAGIALISVLLAIVFPSVGIAQDKFAGAWTGVFLHKNTLGKMMSLSVIIFAVLVAEHQAIITRMYRSLSWGGLLLSLGLVLLTTSQTSLAVSMICISLLWCYRFIQSKGRKRRLYLEVSILLVVILSLLITSSWELLLSIMGRDITLTGRTAIWESSISLLKEHNIWLGYGRAIFWDPESLTAKLAGAGVGRNYIAPHAHNGYIDLALDIGLVGIFCFMASFILTFKHSIVRSFVSRSSKDLWPVIFLIWLVAYNFTESSLMRQENIFWPTYMTIALCAKPTGRALRYRIKKRLNYPKSKILTAFPD